MFPLPAPREGRELMRDPGNEVGDHTATYESFKTLLFSRVLHGRAGLRNSLESSLEKRNYFISKRTCNVLFII